MTMAALRTQAMARLVMAAVVALAIGCVPSVHPFYTSRDLVFDPALVGTWSETGDEKETWTFEKVSDASYRLIVRDGDKSGPFVANLIQLGNSRFLDIAPDSSGIENTTLIDLYKGSLIPGHLVLKVARIEPTLRLAFIDPDWLEKLLRDRPAALQHMRTGDHLVALTASTAELQAFVLKYTDDPDVFADWGELKRRKH